MAGSAGMTCRKASLSNGNGVTKSDERILGDGDFVDRVLSDEQERMERRCHLMGMGFGIESIADHVCQLLAIDREDLFTSGKEPAKVILGQVIATRRELKLA